MSICRLRFNLHEVELRDGGATTIGSDLSCTITLGGEGVSRRHAQIEVDGVRAVIRDLKSRNGVFVNGRRIVEKEDLMDGDRIRVATHQFVACIPQNVAAPLKRITGKSVACQRCGEVHSVDHVRCPACGGPRE